MRVLLVDDDESSRELLADHLEEQMGHRVTRCADGAEALEEFRRNPYPLVVTDIKMPGMSGVELLKAIRSGKGGDRTDVVLMTAYDETSTISKAFNHGAFEYLLKPIRLRDFEEIIARIIKHRLESGQ